MKLLLLALLLLLIAFLTFSLTDKAGDHDSQPVKTWGREAVALDESLLTTTTAPTTTTTRATTSRARSAPTVRTASATPPAVVRPSGVLQDLIRQGFARFGAEVAEQAVRVAGCESTGDETGNRLDERATNGQHAGLFQISRTYHEDRARRLGFTWDQMWTAEPNIAVAADLFSESGWGPWTCRWAA